MFRKLLLVGLVVVLLGVNMPQTQAQEGVPWPYSLNKCRIGQRQFVFTLLNAGGGAGYMGFTENWADDDGLWDSTVTTNLGRFEVEQTKQVYVKVPPKITGVLFFKYSLDGVTWKYTASTTLSDTSPKC